LTGREGRRAGTGIPFRQGRRRNRRVGSDEGNTIIAGYGLPGRSVADVLHDQGRKFCVIEFNPETVERCAAGHVPIIAGDARDPEVLKRAGIETAAMLVVAVPDEGIAIAVVQAARRLNAGIRIVARCTFISGGMKAVRAGADDVVVAEQVVAEHLTRAALYHRPTVQPPPSTL
jgi:voltage-gated potassium channel Kch